jgi:hypothetical protein
LTDDQVTFRWRDSAHHNEHKLMSLVLDEFLRRFLLHTLPKGFVRIRHFGFLANRRRAALLPLCVSTTRRRTAIAIRTRSLALQAAPPTLALSQVWRPHGSHRQTDCSPASTPFSTFSRRSRCMKLQLRSCSSVLPITCRRGAPWLPHTKLLAWNFPTQTTIYHSAPPSDSLRHRFPESFSSPSTPLNLHKRFLTGGFLQTAVSDAPRRKLQVDLESRTGRGRYSTSVSG